MSDRLTNKWTSTTEEAYGPRGKRGRDGETFVRQYLESMGLEVIDNESDVKTQLAGQDLIFTVNGTEHSVDVKSNLTDRNTFYVEIQPNGWLFDPRKISNLICHVNPRKGIMFWYTREKMQEHINNILPSTEPMLKFSKYNLPSFVKERNFER